MPLFMDHHKGVEGLTAEAVADAHRKDMEIQEQYGVTYQPDQCRLQTVRPEQVFETPHRSPQPPLWT